MSEYDRVVWEALIKGFVYTSIVILTLWVLLKV